MGVTDLAHKLKRKVKEMQVHCIENMRVTVDVFNRHKEYGGSPA